MELTMWMIYLDEQWNEPSKLDWYLAQIAADIRKGPLKDADKIVPKDALIRFDQEKREDDDREETDKMPTADRVKQKLDVSKAYWLALAGISSKSNPKVKKAPGRKGSK